MEKKAIYLALFLCALPFVLFAQEEESCSIPNGGFELWKGDTPVNWGSTNVTQNSPNMPGDFKSIFKSTDSKSGNYSIHLKNPSTVDYLNKNEEYVKAMSQYPQYKKMAEEMMKKQSMSASVFWCQGDCNNAMISNPKAILDNIQIPVKERPKALCGYYKTNLKNGDKLWINPFLIAEDGTGGGPAPDEKNAVITSNTKEWTAFKIPLHIPEIANDKEKKVTAAGVQFYIVGKSFPNVPPYTTNGMQLAMSIPGTENSEVWLDDICFCDAPEMEIFNAEAVDGKKINQALMLEMGAQTFVNIDNDDEGETFDYDPKTQISKTNLTKIDNDLVKLRIKVPYAGEPNPPEEIAFEITKGAKNVLFWKDNKKTEKFDPALPLMISTDFEKIGNFWIKEIWVEGIEAHTEQRGSVFKMYPKNDPENFQEAALTIIGIEKMEWEGRNNSINHNNKLDYDVNFRNPSDAVQTPSGNIKCDCDVITESSSYLRPTGVRVFPGKRIKSKGRAEDTPRNKVTLNVTLSVKPIYPIKVYFKSFDVDDPTLDASSIESMDNESQPEDNLGFLEKNDKKLKSGYLEGQDQDGILKVDFIESTEQLNFEVSLQPGDNFRVVGAFEKDFLKTLENDDTKLNKNASEVKRNNDKQRIVDPNVLEKNPDEAENAEIRLAENFASKPLTVWRFMYAEVDKMGPIGKDVMLSKIVSYELNSPKPGQTKIFIADNIIKKLETDGVTKATMGPTHTHVGIKDAFKEGEFKVLGQNFKILENSANEAGYIFSGAADNVVIDGLLTGIDGYEGKVCGLKFDDETKWGFKAGDAMPDLNPDICVLERIFRPTYVVLDFDAMNTDAINPNKETQFIRNTNADDFAAIKSNYSFDNKNLAEDPEFWCFYINTCFAGATAEDGDPDDGNIAGSWENAITGIADDEKLGINIFMEGLLEFNKLKWTNRDKYLCTRAGIGSGKGDVIAHEIAHLFGAVHEIDQAIMNITANHFSELTISRIRKGKHP
ncbi:MAG: hypothetical protein COW44_08635 [Flavobacteriaceae bacterium CG17_big_fil_post_rev_8_21_14_2_50_33_15]|nr:hypothetical protein [Flavobacteriia bacterium]NCQ14824.1 hypothetical protein [Flavobacteriales bacterium]NCT14370.1 hypothetical protein [Flavobacteriales bacterium]PIV93613.1 MAG: hypothetical protein COW44_08635 [Flavobacteriaceae bacterium CG17_big_fil_post_rev_8_21_14_2_50_33_15]